MWETTKKVVIIIRFNNNKSWWTIKKRSQRLLKTFITSVGLVVIKSPSLLSSSRPEMIAPLLNMKLKATGMKNYSPLIHRHENKTQPFQTCDLLPFLHMWYHTLKGGRISPDINTMYLALNKPQNFSSTFFFNSVVRVCGLKNKIK